MARPFFTSLPVLAVALLFLAPPSALAVIPLGQPSWSELTTAQKEILSPLSAEWDTLEPWRRKKWIGVAQRYPAMKPDEQVRVQRRMKEWLKLTPSERQAAREQYSGLKKASPEQKDLLKQKWEEYKGLPEVTQKHFKNQATARPVPKSGASKPLSATLPALPPAAASPSVPVDGGSQPLAPTPAPALTPAPGDVTAGSPAGR